MKEKSEQIVALENLYKDVGNNWVVKNSLVLNIARQSGVAIGGSIAMAITRKKAVKEPGDIDLFTDSQVKAEDFIKRLTSYLNGRPNTYYDMRINNRTEHCLEGVVRHYRVKVPFWLPICVMVLEKPIRTFYWNKMPVQFFDDVVSAAKKASDIDGKTRIDFDFEDDEPDVHELPKMVIRFEPNDGVSKSTPIELFNDDFFDQPPTKLLT